MPTTSSQFIFIGNLGEIDTDESDTDSENPSAVYGTYDNSQMTVTQVTQDDDDGDGLLQADDIGQTADTFTYDLGGGLQTNALDSAGRYSVDYIDENGDPQSATVSVYQTDNGDTFLKFPDGLHIQSVTINSIVQDDFSSITFGTSSTADVVCFAAGTYVQTAEGLCRVEDLMAGQLVETIDNGFQPIRWIQVAQDVRSYGANNTNNCPILIRAGALGRNRPANDLIVSQQHRIMEGGRDQLIRFFDTEVFAPAKALTRLPGIRRMPNKNNVIWVHFAFDTHELIFANGCVSESLLLGPMVLNALSKLQKRIVADHFGTFDPNHITLNGPSARPCLTVGETRSQIKASLLQKKQVDIAAFDADLMRETPKATTPLRVAG